MAINHLIATIISARLSQALERSLVFGQAGIVDRSYEGEIQAGGSTVRVGMISDPTVFDYTRNADMPAPEALADTSVALVLDQQKAFNFAIDSIDELQTNPDLLDEAARRGAYRLQFFADAYIAGVMADNAAPSNWLGSPTSPLSITSANESYQYLVEQSVKLDEKDVPSARRFVIVPPWFHGLLLRRQEFVFTSAPESQDRLVNGLVGRAAGFDVYKSNHIPFSGSTYRIIAGVDMGTAFAQQIMRVEVYRPERRFADAVKGLHVYGAKVLRPEMLSVLHVERP